MMHDPNDTSSSVVDTLLASIQPLRSLAQNWDIDIASCLEEYLQELLQDEPLGRVRVASSTQQDQVDEESADNCSLNFAQAALVLQNSSFVYSRKVEYLYSLVYKALEDIASSSSTYNSKNGGARRGTSRNHADADVEEFFSKLGSHNHEFLLLNDDDIPKDNSQDHTKIALADDDEYVPRRKSSLRASLSARTRLSMSAFTAGDRTSMNNSSSVVATMSEAAHRALAGSLSATSLRLVDLHSNMDRASGSLLMPGVLASSTTNSPANSQQHQQLPDGNLGNDNAATGSGADDYDDDDDDGGAGFAMADDDDDDPGPAVPDAANEPPQPTKRVTFATNDPLPEEVEDDPWELLDPHSSGTTGTGNRISKDRPLRIGKTLRLPPGLDTLPSDCATGARTKQSTSAWQMRKDNNSNNNNFSSVSCLATETFKATVAARKRSFEASPSQNDDNDDETALFLLPSVPLKGLAFGEEFAYIAKEMAKRRAAERRDLRKQEQHHHGVAAGSAPHVLNQHVNNCPYADNDNEDDDGYAFGGHDDDDRDDDDNGGAFFDNDDQNGVGLVGNNTGMASLDDAYQGTTAADSSAAPAAQTFEDLCRAHLQNFARGAEKYRSETQLSKRVRTWQDRLAPLLEEEERRGAFDIHSCGEAVIQSVQTELDKYRRRRRASHNDNNKNDDDFFDEKLATRVEFRHVARNLQQYQVCRMFLATLSLCNAGNVQISAQLENDGRDDNNINKNMNLSIELLYSEIERPMETYLAPSALGVAAAAAAGELSDDEVMA